MNKKNNKYFIITIDTEGDNLWDYKKGETVTTENTKFLPRFQNLCDEFEFKPVYLTNYEMVNDPAYVKTVQEWVKSNLCEIGVHLHAWNNPPYHKLEGPYDYNPYLIEYPYEVMYNKFKVIYNLLCNNFGIPITSHRAGRWAMDNRYFKLLSEFGITVDCSVTPGLDWSNNVGITRGGSNYQDAGPNVFYIDSILEVPMTVRHIHHNTNGSLLHRAKTILKGEHVWLRPASHPLPLLKKLIDKVETESQPDYLEFMVHSSELMPGGSPYFKTPESVDVLYKNMREIFSVATQLGYKGTTLQEYYKIHNDEKNRTPHLS